MNLYGFLDLNEFSDQWYKIDFDYLQDELLAQETNITPAQLQIIEQLLTQADILKTIEKIASEKVDGVNTNHYKFTIDEQKLFQLITNLIEVMADREIEEYEYDSMQEVREEIMEYYNGEISAEIWIGKKDYLPYKFVMNNEFKDGLDEINISTMLTFKNYNQSVQIETPSPVKSLEELIESYYSVPSFDQYNIDSINKVVNLSCNDDYSLTLDYNNPVYNGGSPSVMVRGDSSRETFGVLFVPYLKPQTIVCG